MPKRGNSPATIALTVEARNTLKSLGVLLTARIGRFPVCYSDVIMEADRIIREALAKENAA